MTDLSRLSDDELRALYSAPQKSLADMSDDELRAAYGAPEMGWGDTAADVIKSAGSGLVRGGAVLAGLPADLSEMGARGLDVATRFIGDKLGANIQERPNQTPTLGSQQILGGIQSVTGDLHKPQTTAGEFAQTIGEFAPGIVAGPGGIGARALTQVVAPAVASEAAGQLTKGSDAEPYARVAGAIAGGFAPSALSRAISPLPINAERAGAVNTLRNEGVTDLTAGQVTGRKPLQYLEAERGRGANLMESQGEQFTQAVLRRVGENAERATPEVIDRAFTRIGGEFDRLAANNAAVLDQRFNQAARAAVDDYNNLVSAPNRVPAVENFVQEITNAAQAGRGALTGQTYQSLRSRMQRAERGMGANPEARTAIRDMREALDDAMERSIARSGNPADIAAWQNARQQYRNMIVVEQAATGAGEGAAAGLISPAKLREATVNKQGRRNYARGQGDFADLARSGVQVMTPLPNSGTAGRISAQNMGAGALSMAGGVGAGASSGGDPTSTALGFLAGAIAPRAVGRAATSRLGRSYLGNQAATGLLGNVNQRQAGLLNALMASQQQRLESSR